MESVRPAGGKVISKLSVCVCGLPTISTPGTALSSDLLKNKSCKICTYINIHVYKNRKALILLKI